MDITISLPLNTYLDEAFLASMITFSSNLYVDSSDTQSSRCGAAVFGHDTKIK
jgi:hypothetical protein